MQNAQNYQKNIVNFDSFNLDRRIVAGIMHAGFEEPTPVQKEVIPYAMEGRDIIGTAQTGTGKTAAFLLPILQKLSGKKDHKLRALIVTPTRELADQIYDNIIALGKRTGLRSVTLFGGVSDTYQIRALEAGVDIAVVCPGRFIDLVYRDYVNTDDIEILVLDEADRMLDMGFLPDIKRILGFLTKKRQTMLFSATFPPEIEALAKRTLTNPKRIALGLSKPATTVAHSLFPVQQHLKAKLLLEILKTSDTGSVLIFTRTKYRADGVMRKVKKMGYTVTSLHSNRSQPQRLKALRGFKTGAYRIMAATDIAARGLDIEDVSHVINFDMPSTPDDYIHRIGRTGRAEKTGDAFTFVTPDDEQMIKRLERIMGSRIERKTLESFDYKAPKPDHPRGGTYNKKKTSSSHHAAKDERSRHRRTRRK
ncbi:DEAD/DEAH box helicase [Candidatus Calescamantes bacterium]|nr:DEAD/DEAH box helicase [Candidatus Calescamantes bacterium]